MQILTTYFIQEMIVDAARALHSNTFAQVLSLDWFWYTIIGLKDNPKLDHVYSKILINNK